MVSGPGSLSHRCEPGSAPRPSARRRCRQKDARMNALPPYRDPALAVEDRVADLVGRMTLEEKVGQMLQLNSQGGVEHLVTDLHVGSILHTSPCLLYTSPSPRD